MSVHPQVYRVLEQVEVDSSHCGMSVNPDVYRVLDTMLDTAGEDAWNG